MILNLTDSAIAQALAPRKRDKNKYQEPKNNHPSRLPGEPRPFIPLTQRTTDQLNRVPPQFLAPDGTITSSREHEVSNTDPLLQRIRELEAENTSLRAQLAAKASP